MRRFDAAMAKMSTVFAFCAAVITSVIMIITLMDVIVRNATGGSIPGAFEVTTMLLVAVVFLGLAHAERTGSNIKLTLLTTKLSTRVALIMRSVSGAVTLIVVTCFAWMTWNTALTSYDRADYQLGLLAIPLWPARLAIAIGFTALCIEVLLGIRRRWQRAREELGEASFDALHSAGATSSGERTP